MDASKREDERWVSDSEAVVIECSRGVAGEVAYEVGVLAVVCLAEDEDRDLAACSVRA